MAFRFKNKKYEEFYSDMKFCMAVLRDIDTSTFDEEDKLAHVVALEYCDKWRD